MQRINSFLGEEEVPDWASSLKRAAVPPDPANQTGSRQAEKIGYENATLEWHRPSMQAKGATGTGVNVPVEGAERVERRIEDEEGHPRLDTGQPISILDPLPEVELIQEEAGLLSRSEATANPVKRGRVQLFKLQNINVTLPPGKLTLVTGITGAGKTAFLVGLLGGEQSDPLVSTRSADTAIEMSLLKGSVHLDKSNHRVVCSHFPLYDRRFTIKTRGIAHRVAGSSTRQFGIILYTSPPLGMMRHVTTQ
jgi:hypothetical protein